MASDQMMNVNPTPDELKAIIRNTFTPFELGEKPKSVNGKIEIYIPNTDYNEVYPGILLGGRKLALDLKDLQANKVTHVLNTAQGKKFSQVNTNASLYAELGIEFCGFQGMDVDGFKLKKHFQPCADFIDQCLESQGKVYVHCYQGISRSATIVIAFLMLKRGMNVTEAATTVRRKRTIFPNVGFVQQLCELKDELYPKLEARVQ